MNHIFLAFLEGLPKEYEKGGEGWTGSSHALILPPSLGKDSRERQMRDFLFGKERGRGD